MKKILIALIALLVMNSSCKKAEDTGIVCDIPPPASYLSLVIKNNNGDDLLSDTIAGSYRKEQIQFYKKDANGTIKLMNFTIRPPFSYNTPYTTNESFKYSQLATNEITVLAKSINDTFYLKLGNDKLYKLNLKVNNYRLEKVLIDHQEAVLEKINNPYLTPIYSIKL